MKGRGRASALRMSRSHEPCASPPNPSRGGGLVIRSRRAGLRVVGVLVSLAASWGAPNDGVAAHAATTDVVEGYQEIVQDPDAPATPAPPAWRFRKADRPVKVVVLAGSIGAWRKSSYAATLETMCTQVEVKNLSTVGMGAYALKRRFIEQVLRNWNLRWNDPLLEYWLVFQGGLNSVGTPRATNHHIRELFVKAHKRGFGVVGLTLTPWGDDADPKRWGPLTGLDYLRHTQRVVDFVLGKLSPEEALGSYATRRGGTEEEWRADELADVRVDLYDSPLRDADAAPRDVQRLRERFASQRSWQRAHRDLGALARAEALERDAVEAASVPQWWLREDLRAFDHIHPNSEGHALISALMCPSLPESWGCACSVPVDVERMDEVPSEVATPIAPPARSVTPSEAPGAEQSFPDLPALESTLAPRP